MREPKPLDVRPLFRPLLDELVALLRKLDDDQWERPTVCPGWRVRDIAAHLLDSDLRRLSLQRDGFAPPPPPGPIEGYRDLVDYLNELNAQWVAAFRRLSPKLLVELIEHYGMQAAEHLESLAPDEPAIFPVAWAGHETSPNWFDVAREYTEDWHHQQQIRDAVGAKPLTSRRWLHPVLDTFARGLPHAYRDQDAPEECFVVVEIQGEAGDVWTLRRTDGVWRLFAGLPDEAPEAHVRMTQDTAWRLFTKGLPREAAKPRLDVQGDRRLGKGVLGFLAVMA